MGSTSIGMAGGVGKFFEGKKMQRRAESLIDSFEFSKLNNVQENRQVSTRGADLAMEQNDMMAATSVNALAGGGARSLQGGLGRVQANTNQVARQAGANLDMQEKEIQAATAQDNAIIRGMTENRETNEIAGYGQMLNVGMGMKYGGVADVYNSVASFEDKVIKVAGMATGTGS
tara:strand:+ start:301 stop:822 length:522 start_codon:yes stop_codon:yes gene_type:complete